MPPRKRKAYVQATFGPRGQALWDALAPTLNVARRVLLDEACRLADRLDLLDAAVNAATSPDERGPLMAEARMQTTALRQVITELSPTVVVDAAPAADGSASDDLAAKRAERRAAAAAAVRPAQ